MAITAERNRDYKEICGYREGARYCKMDLHTHTPASQCSSFSLPTQLDAVFPEEPPNPTRKWRDECYEFLKKLAGGEQSFDAAYDEYRNEQRPSLAGPPRLDPRAIRRIARSWLDQIWCDYDEQEKRHSAAEKDERDARVTLAFRDVRNYLASLVFPEEFVLRCYIEGLQLVALTDHNHPGYIVPRLPALGTWLSALQTVNADYAKDVRSRQSRGEKVRAVMIARLRLAHERLEHGFAESSHTDREIGKQHKEAVRKKLRAQKARLAHIRERLDFWECAGDLPRPLTLLPGVEITVSNVHLLAHFPPEWYVPGRIGSILRAIGIPEEQWGNGFVAAASASVQDTIELVAEEGGVAIPAHANSDFKGLLRLFRKGLALNKVLEHPALLALETIGGSVIAKEPGKPGLDACESLAWLDSGRYRPARTKPLCFVKGSDAHECRIELDGTGEDLGLRLSYVKLDIRPNDTAQEIFGSLRLALLSGQNRVIEYPTEDGYNYAPPDKDYRLRAAERASLIDCELRRPTILGMTVEGAGSYADGLAIRFNPYLNCVIGSGGKSTVVRLVGYAFGVQSFMRGTRKQWLPELVRLFWREADSVYCVEREGRSIDPNGDDVKVRWFERLSEADWQQIEPATDVVETWPPAALQDARGHLTGFEDDIIEDLVKKLQFRGIDQAKPLLVNQPREIFNSARLFEQVLARPRIKARQIIWSTASANVPTSLDAEKIIVTREKRKGRQMELVCAGDVHEEEIREQLLCHFEGGWPAFARRVALYWE